MEGENVINLVAVSNQWTGLLDWTGQQFFSYMACMHACMCVCVCVCVCVSVSMCVCVHVHVCVYTCIVWVSDWVWVWVCDCEYKQHRFHYVTTPSNTKCMGGHKYDAVASYNEKVWSCNGIHVQNQLKLPVQVVSILQHWPQAMSK